MWRTIDAINYSGRVRIALRAVTIYKPETQTNKPQINNSNCPLRRSEPFHDWVFVRNS